MQNQRPAWNVVEEAGTYSSTNRIAAAIWMLLFFAAAVLYGLAGFLKQAWR